MELSTEAENRNVQLLHVDADRSRFFAVTIVISYEWICFMSACIYPSIAVFPEPELLRIANHFGIGKNMELKSKVLPLLRKERGDLRTSFLPTGSSPDIGSSRIRKSGSLISACARPIR
jgi:hypothetical protein